ncbi:MAG TPA: hypothetical protein VKU41_17750, partial [Polyangiaceae bacterium]|nr:hypothetical protein [Polyangiaceae bacterium]
LVLAVGAVLIEAVLRAEESRLARELRTARSGTTVLRSLAVRRREQLPFFARLFSTRIGMAALLLADGERSGALTALATEPFLMRGGRLDGLRAIVDADVERATGTSVGLDRCVGWLREAPPLGHREADLYRTHVLVKAILERGDADTGVKVAECLVRSADDEERVYATWLRVWFDMDAADAGDVRWPDLTEGDLRVAALAARAHGAERLVELFDTRLAAIARPEGQG